MKSNVYTRTGDNGSTSLVDGSRTGKDSRRVDAYGDVDELSSSLGLLAASVGCPEEIRGQLTAVQNMMFEIGSYLASPDSMSSMKPEGLDAATKRLEDWIDTLDEQTPEIRSFILPAGCEASCRSHVARTVCRRAERKIIGLAREERVDPEVIAYINRLSDYLFVCARYLNFLAGVDDVAWKRN